MWLLETVRGKGLYANTGGPMSRTRKQQISSSLLGRDSGDLRCPKARTLGLRFDEGESAVEAMEKLLRTVGLDGPEGLRGLFRLPDMPMMARAASDQRASLNASSSEPGEVLEQALWLGLCSPFLFDPRRPLIWTETSLRRHLELFEPAGFYA